MPARPNFTEVRLRGNKIRLMGNSLDDPLPIDIRVYLEQPDSAGGAAQTAFGSVDKLTTAWHAEVPAHGFTTGPALASGVEVRMEPFTAITWTEQVEIE